MPTPALLLNRSPGHNPRQADPYEALDRLGQDLAVCPHAAGAVRAVLGTLQLALGADTVYSCSIAAPEPIEVVGRIRPALAWCQEVAQYLLSQAPGTDSQLLRSRLVRPHGKGDGFPRSAVMVRVSKSRSIWIVALNFDADYPFQPADVKVMCLARRMLVNHHRQLRVHEGLKQTVLGLIHSFVAAVDAKDSYTGSHSERVARIAVRLGQQMRLPAPMLSDLYLAGLLHDIGKIGVRDEVLQKPGLLTPQERAHVQEHTTLGGAMIARVPQLRHLIPLVRGHHEHFNGKGYPDGLAGEAIPLLARILAVADGCDALVSDRPYRRALPPAEADVILNEGAGQQWDPEVIKHFATCRQELYSISHMTLGDSAFTPIGQVIEAQQEGPYCAPDVAGSEAVWKLSSRRFRL
jgi:HD-GYP domain-containing protein (c-di-GMP phosphodiesterase class II)